MSTTVVALPKMSEHLAYVAAPWADMIIEGMAARGTGVAGIALLPDVEGEVYGPRGCVALAEGLGRRMPAQPDSSSVLVITPHCIGWISVSALAIAAGMVDP